MLARRSHPRPLLLLQMLTTPGSKATPESPIQPALPCRGPVPWMHSDPNFVADTRLARPRFVTLPPKCAHRGSKDRSAYCVPGDTRFPRNPC
ncbi:hypothetical protein VTO73DRAFT_4911 [Trametes versicolor]